MTLRYSTPVRNAMVTAIETVIGISPKLRIYTGAEPANLTDAPSGTLLAELALPADWLADAANGVKSLSGSWQTNAALAAGDGGYYRIYDSAGTTCHEQGAVSNSAGSGQLKLDSITIAVGQQVVIATYSRTAPNA